MPVQIGAKAHDFSDPTGLLSDCHLRIEMFLGSLQRVAEIIDSPLTAEDRVALDAALCYFREAAPKHTQDEEDSLFPRLRQIQSHEIQCALTELDALEGDHRRAESLHAEVDRLGMRCVERGCPSRLEADRFRQAVSDLVSIYGGHIRIEDHVVFPAAQGAVSSPEKCAIGHEMASRRDLVPWGCPGH